MQNNNNCPKKLFNFIFIASRDNLKKMTIRKDSKSEYLTIQGKYPIFICLGI